jgi:peptidyl-prolyl cis-trans isomerase C
MISFLLLLACGDSTNDVSGPTPGALPNGGEVIHTAHGIEVGQDLLDAFLAGLNAEQKEQANSASNRIRLAGELAKTELLYREAIKQGLHQTEQAKARLKIVQREQLVEMLQTSVIESRSDDAAIKAFYDKHLPQFRAPQKELELIATPDEALAKRLMKEIEEGADFAALAQEHSVDQRSKAEGGKLGWVPMPSLIPEVAAKIQAAAEGDLVGPINLGGATGFFRIGASRDLIPLEDVKDGIAQDAKFKAAVLENYITELGGDAKPTTSPALLQAMDTLPEGLVLPGSEAAGADHSGHDHGGHDHGE